MQTASVQDGEQRLAYHQYAASQAKAEIAKALNALQSAQNELLASKLESAISAQRNVELEALNFTKNVNSLYQRAAKWKSEQKRLRGALEGIDKFEDWATATEIDLQGIAGNLEYVCSVLEKEQHKDSNGALIKIQKGEMRINRTSWLLASRAQRKMARKAVSKKEKAPAVDAVSDKRSAHKTSASKNAKGIAAMILPYLVVAFIIFFVVNRLYLMPQRAASKAAAAKLSAGGNYLSRNEVVERKRIDVPCYIKKKSSKGFVEGCHKFGKACGRTVKDRFVTSEEVLQLREIAETGMANRSRFGGPTIMDVNTGYVKDGQGLVNIYQKDRSSPPIPRFTAEQFALYRRTIEKIRLALMEEFQLEFLYFTAPTFITRLIGNASWSPTEIHDEYWHPHVDKDNTHHYDYSGLLYLSDYEDEFTGGLFAFIDKKSEQIVEPARGRLMMFTAGKENLHQVRKVESGTRYVMSMWFSCDERKRFKNFLDGKMHQHFKRED